MEADATRELIAGKPDQTRPALAVPRPPSLLCHAVILLSPYSAAAATPREMVGEQRSKRDI